MEGVVDSGRGCGVQKVQEISWPEVLLWVSDATFSGVDFVGCDLVVDVEGAGVDLEVQSHQVAHMTSHVTLGSRREGWVQDICSV